MNAAPATSSLTLSESVWRARQADHQARVAQWTKGPRDRARDGQKHPVEDFLFTYYSFRPAWLERWHPGPEVVLENGDPFLRWPEYIRVPGGVMLDPSALPEKRRLFARWLRDFLQAQVHRPALYGCYGLHEWAMVYRQSPEAVRHNRWPLRFAPERLAEIVEAGPVCCTHFDAFRFFTEPARPLNRWELSRDKTPQMEQRGCLHANMDLYKWAYKLAPATPGELLADCFALARDIREIDMRASPYDLQALGYSPLPIETAAGRAEYEGHQRAFTRRGEPLRARLIALCEQLS